MSKKHYTLENKIKTSNLHVFRIRSGVFRRAYRQEWRLWSRSQWRKRFVVVFLRWVNCWPYRHLGKWNNIWPTLTKLCYCIRGKHHPFLAVTIFAALKEFMLRYLRLQHHHSWDFHHQGCLSHAMPPKKLCFLPYELGLTFMLYFSFHVSDSIMTCKLYSHQTVCNLLLLCPKV